MLLPLTAMATPIKGFENYQDWDLVCDNLGTCRMAGYQEDEGFDNRVSLYSPDKRARMLLLMQN